MNKSFYLTCRTRTNRLNLAQPQVLCLQLCPETIFCVDLNKKSCAEKRRSRNLILLIEVRKFALCLSSNLISIRIHITMWWLHSHTHAHIVCVHYLIFTKLRSQSVLSLSCLTYIYICSICSLQQISKCIFLLKGQGIFKLLFTCVQWWQVH